MKQPIFTGAWGKCHIQGIAADLEKGYLYYSFTTKLVKAKLDGTIVGCVDGLLGHLGFIAYNKQDGRVYGSLEYKNDVIGKGILSALKKDTTIEDAFYIAIFDVDKIDRLNMDAEKDGILSTVYLSEVVSDYKNKGENRISHRYGCSGIDGLTFGPLCGNPDSKYYLYVAYGIYSDTNRVDNNHQILLCYDIENWKQYESPLLHESMHRNGPQAPTEKYFVYTGNTTYGVQNLEYDSAENAFFMSVYPGIKKEFPNYSLFIVDATIPPKTTELFGLKEEGKLLCLKKSGHYHKPTGIYGWHFPHGSTGLCSLGNKKWLISEHHVSQSGQCSFLFHYVFDPMEGFILED